MIFATILKKNSINDYFVMAKNAVEEAKSKQAKVMTILFVNYSLLSSFDFVYELFFHSH